MCIEEWLGWKDSNLRPTVSKTGALPTELHPNEKTYIFVYEFISIFT